MNEWKYLAGLAALIIIGGIIIVTVANITRPRSYQSEIHFTRDPNTGAITDALERMTYLER